MASFDPQLVHSSNPEAREFYRRLMADVRRMPGVTSAALAELVPMSNHMDSAAILPEGYQLPKDKSSLEVFTNTVDVDYFRTMDIPILRGRGFLETDGEKAPRVAVVNERFAESYWPGQNPIGRRLRLGGTQGEWVEVVGLARMSKYLGLVEPPA